VRRKFVNRGRKKNYARNRDCGEISAHNHKKRGRGEKRKKEKLNNNHESKRCRPPKFRGGSTLSKKKEQTPSPRSSEQGKGGGDW